MKKNCLLLVMCLLMVHLAFAQNTIPVQGRVVDASTGQPLIGAGVAVQGTSIGTQTDVNGNYTINAPADGTLVISYIAYQNAQVPVNNRNTINIELQQDTEALEEVVVVGYGVQEKRDVTGSIASVTNEELVKQASQNPVSSLQGKVAGVTITNSGAPGASPQIRIRGAGSALGSADPLYVVDGTFVDNLSFLNPADIESIEILKDASSAAIYGVRAANGVVLVTTKRGKAGDSRVNYNGFVGVQRVTNALEMTDAQEYATLINEKNGTELIPTDLPTTDWYDQILRTALIQNHQVSASGGSEKITYSASAGYLNQEGIIEGNEYERITARLQTDFELSENVKVGYNGIFYNYNSLDIPGDIFYQAFVAPPIIPVFKANGNYGDSFDFNVGNFANPQASIDWFKQESSGQQFIGNAFGEVEFLNNFTFRTSLGVNYGLNEFTNYRSQDSLTSVQYASRSLLTQGRSKRTSWLWENTLTYDKVFGEHEITALLGTSAQENKFENFVGSVNDVEFNSDANLYLDLGDPETFLIEADGDRFTFLSYFGRINYTFRDKYLLTATLRYDASSKFPSSDRWEYFPSVGLGWRVIEEEFMQDQTILDNLKLRASWGRLGNNNIPSSIFILPVSTDARYGSIFNGVLYPGRNITQVVSPTLYWEVVEEVDLGVEMGFLNNRLTAEIDWYNKETKDAIFGLTPLGYLGLTGEIRGNYATFRNRGLEAVVNWTDDISDDITYNIGLNFAVNKNEVTGIATGNNVFFNGNLPVGGYQVSITRIGDPIGAFYGYEVDGIFQNEQEVAASAQPNARPGDFRYRDLNDDNIIDERDKTIIGDPNPGFVFGINTGFSYRNFDFVLDIQGVSDVDIYNGNRNVRYGNENFSQDFFDNRWTGPGTSNFYPSASLIGSNLDPNDFFVESGDYIRIRNLQVGYNLPQSLVNNWGMQNFRIYVNAQNPITWFDYNGFSPEVGGVPVSQGIDRNVYPLSATYNFGVNVTF
ncbi:TonB-linked SusC/RagA family outer membrane protein [Pontibacter ummariensis]|uniref:TonB-linked outer membrane protein, SusC/RagA family n=1 Tax=Pontibacter ummariensis TaxID=1610492 RepID=A0A239ISK2_9BACT|nr:TonB-dependent receptor [Pontibacter ummariensis]PRY09680.1 TonB-linked SusC/RagA family outer membrane protein [Pontibacter ummariensis]SNS96178.1 TonB-linked outer membrane protein, SusC/RagA family [Pontibacter ummariensis]